MWTIIGYMYAVEWLNGNVTQERGAIDVEVLEKLSWECASELGLEVGAKFEAYTGTGGTVDNYLLGSIDYYVFGT
jgi:hypothetical protein